MPLRLELSDLCHCFGVVSFLIDMSVKYNWVLKKIQYHTSCRYNSNVIAMVI